MSNLKKDRNILETICPKRKAKCEKMIKKIEKNNWRFTRHPTSDKLRERQIRIPSNHDD
jgi:hypothetical protein